MFTSVHNSAAGKVYHFQTFRDKSKDYRSISPGTRQIRGYPITPEGINAYLNSLTCGNAKHNYYRVIKTLCRWLYHTDQLPTNPIEKVLPPRRQKKLLPAISKDQLDILVNHALTERDKVTLNLLWHSGMRLSEAASIRASDFNWEEGTVELSLS